MYYLKLAFLILLILCADPSAAAGEEAGSVLLIEQAKAYDARQIVYTGEVIGDILNAGDHVWLNVSDGSNAIGIWTAKDLAVSVRVPGRYSQQGDTVRVTGKFNRACAEHGGDMDLHADSLVLIKRGTPTGHPVPAWKIWLAALLTIPALILLVKAAAGFTRKPGRHAPGMPR